MATANNRIKVHDIREYRKYIPNYSATVRTLLYRGVDSNGCWKWMVSGERVPFPVRSYTWFDGFDPDTMNKWMLNDGWKFVTKIRPPC